MQEKLVICYIGNPGVKVERGRSPESEPAYWDPHRTCLMEPLYINQGKILKRNLFEMFKPVISNIGIKLYAISLRISQNVATIIW